MGWVFGVHQLIYFLLILSQEQWVIFNIQDICNGALALHSIH